MTHSPGGWHQFHFSGCLCRTTAFWLDCLHIVSVIEKWVSVTPGPHPLCLCLTLPCWPPPAMTRPPGRNLSSWLFEYQRKDALGRAVGQGLEEGPGYPQGQGLL